MVSKQSKGTTKQQSKAKVSAGSDRWLMVVWANKSANKVRSASYINGTQAEVQSLVDQARTSQKRVVEAFQMV